MSKSASPTRTPGTLSPLSNVWLPSASTGSHWREKHGMRPTMFGMTAWDDQKYGAVL
jgi:hypothetical protein